MQPSTNPTILIADDDQFIGVAYKAGLEQAGYQVLVARDGQETLEILRTNPPDLLLLDLIMPKLNGFEVLQSMQDEGLFPNIPVIVLTNLSQDSDEAEVRSYGVTEFLVKADVSLKDLIERIEQTLVGNQTPDSSPNTFDTENPSE